MDRNFPIIRTKELIEQYNALPEKNGDMIDFLRTNLAETHGEFSRQKIIKQISYLGVVYEKKKPTSKSYKWSEGLRTELSALKEQYSELDDEDRELIDLVDYCTRRLSEKKPKRQVKQELIALGAVLKPDGKRQPSVSEPSRSPSPSGSEGDEGRNSKSLSSSKRTTKMDRGHDEESDVDLELDDGLDHQEEDDTITVFEGNAQSMVESAKEFESEETHDPGPNKELDSKEQSVDASSPASTPDHVRRIKRKRVISSSDEEDSAETADAEEKQEEEPAPESPLPISQAKRNRLIIDSDED